MSWYSCYRRLLWRSDETEMDGYRVADVLDAKLIHSNILVGFPQASLFDRVPNLYDEI